MSVIYEQAEESVHDLARLILEQYHPELRFAPPKDDDNGYVRLCILMASTGDDDSEPAVKCHGYPAQAVISVIPIKQRVDKRADAEIVIDRANWQGLDERKRVALLDHEITHLEIKTTETKSGVKVIDTDDIGRPKLKLRLHDFDFGGFRSVARRYGEDAPEVILAKHFEEDYGQDVLRAGGSPSLPFAETATR